MISEGQVIMMKASRFAPNHLEVSYWIDLTEDPNGSAIKSYNGKQWGLIKSGSVDSLGANKVSYADNTVEHYLDGIRTSITDITNRLSALEAANVVLQAEFENMKSQPLLQNNVAEEEIVIEKQ